MNRTNIPWLRSKTGVRGYTWNPITGCTYGCTYCWARKHAEGGLRGKFGYPEDDPFQVIFRPERLSQPAKVKKPSKVFVCSMGDLFDPKVEYSWIHDTLMAMSRANQHEYFLLTKQSLRMRCVLIESIPYRSLDDKGMVRTGISASNQRDLENRLNDLEDLNPHYRFVSIEPILEHIDLAPYWTSPRMSGDRFSNLDMIIAGCDSRPAGVRLEAKVEWFRSLWRQCEERGIKFMLKQIVVDGKLVMATTCDGLDPRILEG